MRALTVLLALAASLAAFAEDPPPAAPPPAPPAVQWKAQAKAGLVSTSGNAQTTTLNAGALASRTDPENKIALEGVVTYGRSGVLVVRDTNGNGQTDPGEIGRDTQTTADAWNLKARYDRFLTPRHGAFAAASIGADRPAGKTVIGGGQAGYAAKIVKTATQELVAELGYDFSYEEYERTGVKAVSIHSGRVFLGETLKLSDTVGFVGSVEALANLNEEDAPNAHGAGKKVQAFDDVRVNGKISVTAAVRSNVSLSFGFALRWDRNPAPLPAIAGAPPFAPGYFPFAKEVDTVTDAALIVTFL